jgi:hypothetical protein
MHQMIIITIWGVNEFFNESLPRRAEVLVPMRSFGEMFY